MNFFPIEIVWIEPDDIFDDRLDVESDPRQSSVHVVSCAGRLRERTRRTRRTRRGGGRGTCDGQLLQEILEKGVRILDVRFFRGKNESFRCEMNDFRAHIFAKSFQRQEGF